MEILLRSKINLVRFWKHYFPFTDHELKAFLSIQRENFIPKEFYLAAYADSPLPLLRGKTISQPTTIMIMNASLEIKKGEKVLEIGTGSGYHASLLSKLVGKKGKIFTTEVIPELVAMARKNLETAKIKNVQVFEVDGSRGLPGHTFDKIILTAACHDFPQPLLEQLNPYGIIIAPIGNREEQVMTRGIKDEIGNLAIEKFGSYLFTPLHGKWGFED